MHRLLRLPVQHNSTPEYNSLGDRQLQEICCGLKNVLLWMCDEVSMVNNITFQYIHKRMGEISGQKEETFGGMNVIFVGDLLQLKPINEGEVFETVTKPQNRKYLKGLLAPTIWQDLEFHELTINQRQEDNPRFANILGNVRTQNLQLEDCEYLYNNCKYEFPENTTPEQKKRHLATFVNEERKKGRDHTILLTTNEACREINNEILNLLEDERFPTGKFIKAKDLIIKTRARYRISDWNIENQICEMEKDARNTAGLERILKVKIGSKELILTQFNRLN